MKKKLEDYSVIIPTVGRTILKECLAAILNGSAIPKRIVVIDQGENPDVESWLKEAGHSDVDIQHVHSNGRSPSSARNEGMEHVKTTFVAAVDDDCLVEYSWLEKMNFHLQKDSGLIVTGRVEAGDDGVPPTIITSTTFELIRHLPFRNLSPLATGNMGVSTELARQIGDFDENLFTAEDTDWAYRALKANIPLLYAPDVIVFHHHWRDRSQSAVNYRAYAKGLGAFFGKHLRQGDLSMILRALLALYRGGKSLLKGQIQGDENLILEGKARLTHLIPGMIDSFRGIGFSR